MRGPEPISFLDGARGLYRDAVKLGKASLLIGVDEAGCNPAWGSKVVARRNGQRSTLDVASTKYMKI